MSIYLVNSKATVLSANQKEFVELLSADGRVKKDTINRMTCHISPLANYIVNIVNVGEFKTRLQESISSRSIIIASTLFDDCHKDIAYIDNFERADEIREFPENMSNDATMILVSRLSGARDTYMYITLPEEKAID